jgi:xanthine dehydrogenase small subunit
LTRLRAQYPDAMLLSGGTDLGLSVSKDRVRPAVVIHTAHVAELQRIDDTDDALVLGAAVSYTNALPNIERLYPSFAEMIRRIGSRQIRNLGTIGGNIGNASPIGDTPPCLIALDASLTLVSLDGEREIAVEDFFLDYRKTDLRPGEVIRSIRIPKLTGAQSFRTYKVSKRYDQDISAVIGAYRLTMDGDAVTEARIAYGGMAATPKRAPAMEAALTGAVWSEETASRAGLKAAEDFSPLSDHRATAEYRALVAANLCTRLYRDLAGTEAELEVVRV